MRARTIEDILSEISFFHGMSNDHLKIIAQCGKLAFYKKDQFLIREGTHADMFFVIRTGEAAIEAFAPGRGPILISTIKTNGIVGYSWLFPPFQSCFDVRARTDVKVIALDGKCLHSKSTEDHELGYSLMSRFASIILQRLQNTRRQLVDVYRV
jgi:CRP-like cAMP-binding protein